MNTTHRIINASSDSMVGVDDNSIALVVTSPPYPIIEMWNECFSKQNKNVAEALQNSDYDRAFDEMHNSLDRVWDEVDRVMIAGGLVCINIGDATKNCNGNFKLYPNHSRIISYFYKKGYSILPDIIWRKQTNAPNKFMGSGMYPAGAYVTYEHEYILIFRKGTKREFSQKKEKKNRQNSAFFWEERNIWFSDIWDLKGTSQTMSISNSRIRSGAFPFEVAYRLINMYSVKGDTVLDPFVGTGTTINAAIASQRNSIGIEIERSLCSSIINNSIELLSYAKSYIQERISKHAQFILDQKKLGKDKFYINLNHNFEVKTRQEIELQISQIESISNLNDYITVTYMSYQSS